MNGDVSSRQGGVGNPTKEHWNIVNGVREAYSARGVYKGSRRTVDTLHNLASKRRKKEECD